MCVTIVEMADLEFALVFYHLEQATTLKLVMHIHSSGFSLFSMNIYADFFYFHMVSDISE